MENTTTTIVKINPLEYGIEETKATQIAEQFRPMIDKMVELEKEYNEVIKIPIDDISAKFKAAELRKKYVKVRTGTAEIHKQQKAFYLSAGRYVDGWKNAQIFASSGIEERLYNIEMHFENIEKERIKNLVIERTDILLPFGIDISSINLGSMDESVWNNFLSGVRLNYENEQKITAAKIEAERLAKEEQEKERIRIAEENAKLKAENEAKEKQLAIERAESEAKLAEERRIAKVEADKKEAALNEERRLAKIESDKKESELAEEKRKLKAIEDEKAEQIRKQEADAEALLNSSDVLKFSLLLNDLNDLKLKYSFKSKKHQKLHSEVSSLIDKITTFAKDKI